MKKILFLLGLFIIFTTSAFMPSHVNEFTVGRLDQIHYDDGILKINFDNFIYVKIYDKFRVFQNRNAYINNIIEINDFPSDISLNKGDIVAIDSYWGGKSSGILKITCEEGIIKIEGTNNKYFGTGLSDKHSDIENNKDLNDDKLLQKVNKVIGCDSLNTFFDKDRRFEDLQGTNLKIYFYIILLFFATITGGILLFKYRKN